MAFSGHLKPETQEELKLWEEQNQIYIAKKKNQVQKWNFPWAKKKREKKRNPQKIK